MENHKTSLLLEYTHDGASFEKYTRDFSDRLQKLLDAVQASDKRDLEAGKTNDKPLLADVQKMADNMKSSNHNAWEAYKKGMEYSERASKKWRIPKSLIPHFKRIDRERLYKVLLANEEDLADVLRIVDKYSPQQSADIQSLEPTSLAA